MAHATATKILLAEGKATGVELRQSGQVLKIKARKEVLLSGGVFNSPQLLQLSGIGPGGHLQKLGIPVVVDSPGVGANLQDHFRISAIYRCTRPITLNDQLRDMRGQIAIGLQYMLFRKGPMASNEVPAGAFLKTEKTLRTPNIQLTLALWSTKNLGRSRRKLDPFPGFTIGITNQQPDSRGTVMIVNPNPLTPPAIRFNFFQSERDRRTMIASLRIARSIAAAPAMADYIVREEDPGGACCSDEDIVAFCRDTGRSNIHPASTCKMGQDEMSVVDERLRVRGISRLRVIDGSIMPTLVQANPNAATIMIGEKGAAMLLEDARAA
jgi:choline dehydrogenase